MFSKFTYTEYIAQYADVPDASEVITFGAADPAYLTASSGGVKADSTYDDALPENGIAGQSPLHGRQRGQRDRFGNMDGEYRKDGLSLLICFTTPFPEREQFN